MAKARDLTHLIFNHVEVLEPAGLDAYRNRRWRCRCLLCGRTDVYRTSSNVTRSFSCGCRVSPRPRRDASAAAS